MGVLWICYSSAKLNSERVVQIVPQIVLGCSWFERFIDGLNEPLNLWTSLWINEWSFGRLKLFYTLDGSSSIGSSKKFLFSFIWLLNSRSLLNSPWVQCAPRHIGTSNDIRKYQTRNIKSENCDRKPLLWRDLCLRRLNNNIFLVSEPVLNPAKPT